MPGTPSAATLQGIISIHALTAFLMCARVKQASWIAVLVLGALCMVSKMQQHAAPNHTHSH
jgi:1,4-dihydroxy-2-naphthoate octaprenyltransferase